MADGSTSGSGSRGNVKNPAIRRIHADIRELQKDPSDQYTAAPLEENLFEWHFTLRGPPGTDFAGGVYHGRILLPAEYPFKPPNIVLLTPNGRFEVGKKICLSISAHHPEHWQPAWGVRLILEALISFFPTDPKGAVGSLDWTPQERRRLAAESQTWCCPRCGLATALLPPEQQQIAVPPPSTDDTTTADTAASEQEQGQAPAQAANRYAAEIAQLYVRGASGSDAAAAVTDESAAAAAAAPQQAPAVAAAAVPPVVVQAAAGQQELRRRPVAAATASTPAVPPQPQQQQQQPVVEQEEEDRLLYIALGLLLLIALLLGRKAMRAAQAGAEGGGMGWSTSGGGAGGEDDFFVG